MSTTRIPIPPAGPPLGFDAWCRVLTAELRRYRGEEVVGHNEDGCYRLRLNPRFGGLQDVDRHDRFTARNFAKTLAGHFDPKFSLADREA